jgi:hypothetical protein
MRISMRYRVGNAKQDQTPGTGSSIIKQTAALYNCEAHALLLQPEHWQSSSQSERFLSSRPPEALELTFGRRLEVNAEDRHEDI